MSKLMYGVGELGKVQTERVHSQAEERKREKETARVRRDKLQTLRDIEARAEAENLSVDAKPTAAEMVEAQSLREEVPLSLHHPKKKIVHCTMHIRRCPLLRVVYFQPVQEYYQ
jgi:hypothetical protein